MNCLLYVLVRWVSQAGTVKWGRGQWGCFRAALIDPSLGGSESGLLRAKATVKVIHESGSVVDTSIGSAVSAYLDVCDRAHQQARRLSVEVRTIPHWDTKAEDRKRRRNATEAEAAAWLDENADDEMVMEARRIYRDQLASRVLRANSASKLYGPDWPRDSLERLLLMREHGLHTARESRARRAEELLLPLYTVKSTIHSDEAYDVGEIIPANALAKRDGFKKLRIVRIVRIVRTGQWDDEYTVECKPA